MSTLINAIRDGELFVILPLAALLLLLLYIVWHRYRFNVQSAETITTTDQTPEFLQSSDQRRSEILEAGEAFDRRENAWSMSPSPVITGLLILILIAIAAYGLYRYSSAVKAKEAETANLINGIDEGNTEAGTGGEVGKKSCEAYPNLC